MISLNPELEQDRAIAKRLPHSWPAFFEKFGRLTSVQRKAIPVILNGNDALIISANLKALSTGA